MGLFDGLRARAVNVLLGNEIAQLREREDVLRNAYWQGRAVVSPAALEQRLGELDSHLFDLLLQQQGWQRVAGAGGGEWHLTEADRVAAIQHARYMTFYDTHSQNAVDTWTDFGFGQRVRWEAVDEPDADEVLQEFWNARRNAPVLADRRIHWLSDETLLTGETIFTLWTNTVTGMSLPVSTLRRVPSEEVVRIECDEDDPDIALYYVHAVDLELDGQHYSEVWYPDWQADAKQLKQIDIPDHAISAMDVRKGTTVVAVYGALNSFQGRGWPRFRQAYEWFNAYRDALGDVMAKNRAVAMFVDKLKVKGGSRAIDQIAASLTSSMSGYGPLGIPERNPAPAPGSTWMENEAVERSRMPLSSGASDDKAATSLVLGQGYAGTGVPVGLVRTDVFQNRSVAEVAMEPWYETMERYQNWWTDMFTDLGHAVLLQAGFDEALDIEISVNLQNPVRVDVGEVAQIVSSVGAALGAQVISQQVAGRIVEQVLELALGRLGVKDAATILHPEGEEDEELPEPEPEPDATADAPEPEDDGQPEEDEEPDSTGPATEEEWEPWVRALADNLREGSASPEDVAWAALATLAEGSDKSGHYGHAGRPGKVGGSLPKTGGGFPDGVLDRLYNSEMAQAVREKVNRRYGDDNRLELELMAANNKLTVEEYTAQTEARVGQLLSESTIAIRAPIDALDDILEDGELQPWTDTKHSGGYKKRDRLQMEEDVLGVPPDARGRDRPIYGYYTMDVDGKSANNVFLGQYGDVIIKLKEATKDRASFTDSDSLDMGMYKRLYASPARTPSIYSLYGLTNSTDVLWLYSNQGPDDGTYWEAQVWGGVTLADIEEIILPSAPDERMAGLLEQAQVPWRVR